MRKLGRLLPDQRARVAPSLRLFAKAPLPLPPEAVDYHDGVPWRMFRNDVLGCCTISGWANGVVQRTALASHTPLVMPDDVVEAIYAHLSGWRPENPASDVGLREADVLTWFARSGVDLGRQAPEVTLWAALELKDRTAFRQAIWLFGHCYIGLLLPVSARGQAVWDVPATGAAGDGAPGSWGGHCVICAGYDDRYVYCVTWGSVQPVTWAFLDAYMDEAYVTHSPGEWIGAGGISPSHFDFAGLAAAYDRIGM
jgi:hypothetical protein